MPGGREEEKRAILITGTSTGIGKACALYLDSIGFKVFAGVRREADGDALRKNASDRLTPVLIDITDSESIDSALKFISGKVGGAGLNLGMLLYMQKWELFVLILMLMEC